MSRDRRYVHSCFMSSRDDLTGASCVCERCCIPRSHIDMTELPVGNRRARLGAINGARWCWKTRTSRERLFLGFRSSGSHICSHTWQQAGAVKSGSIYLWKFVRSKWSIRLFICRIFHSWCTRRSRICCSKWRLFASERHTPGEGGGQWTERE